MLNGFTNACLDNYRYNLINEWREGGSWKSNAHIKPNFNCRLRNWELRLEFNEPLTKNFKAWVVQGYANTKGKSKIVVKPMSWNKVLEPNFDMSYFVNFKNILVNLDCRSGSKELLRTNIFGS